MPSDSKSPGDSAPQAPEAAPEATPKAAPKQPEGAGGREARLARALRDELESLGLQEVTLDDRAYLMATLPANTDKPVPTIGFISHFDTSPDFSADGVQPRLVENYDGKDI